MVNASPIYFLFVLDIYLVVLRDYSCLWIQDLLREPYEMLKNQIWVGPGQENALPTVLYLSDPCFIYLILRNTLMIVSNKLLGGEADLKLHLP